MMMFLSTEVSHAWVAPKQSPTTSRKPTSPKASSASASPSIMVRKHSGSTSSRTAKFYKRSPTMIGEDTARAVATTVLSEMSTATTTTSPTATIRSQSASLSSTRQLPWMEEDSPASEGNNSYFLDMWNWQFSFFEDHLTNLKVRDVQHADESIHDLYYATKRGKKDDDDDTPTEHVYTISLESDEYRDIRMTYMHCSRMQTFRCLSYPRNGDLPIMGMGIMKMGGSKNLAILDYQPLPPTDEKEAKINDAYTAELLKLRKEIPSMSQPMTHRHFDSNEERKYFTEFPLLGRCNELEASEEETQEYNHNLRKALQKYVAKHSELTQTFGSSRYHRETEKERLEYVLERHSDFDTHVCEREPAGPFLCGVFGPEEGGKLVHNVIFPLSRHGLSGHGGTTEE